MQLQEIIPVKLPLYLCLLVLSVTATATLLMAKTPAVSHPQVQDQGDNRTSFLPKIRTDIKIERQSLKASLLSEGMTKGAVEHVIGKPTDTKIFPNSDMHLKILNYRQEPIITKVSLIDGHLSGITTQLKTVMLD